MREQPRAQPAARSGPGQSESWQTSSDQWLHGYLRLRMYVWQHAWFGVGVGSIYRSRCLCFYNSTILAKCPCVATEILNSYNFYIACTLRCLHLIVQVTIRSHRRRNFDFKWPFRGLPKSLCIVIMNIAHNLNGLILFVRIARRFLFLAKLLRPCPCASCSQPRPSVYSLPCVMDLHVGARLHVHWQPCRCPPPA
jgi:hypothetical protein